MFPPFITEVEEIPAGTPGEQAVNKSAPIHAPITIMTVFFTSALALPGYIKTADRPFRRQGFTRQSGIIRSIPVGPEDLVSHWQNILLYT